MNSHRKTAVFLGIAFILATLAPILSGPFLLPLENAPDLLAHVTANPTQLIFGVLLELLMVSAIVTIPVLLLPVLKQHDDTLALGYLSSRIVEVIPFLLGVVSLLLLPALGQHVAHAGAPGVADVWAQTLAQTLVAVNDWAYVVGGQLIFAITALVLNTALYRSRLVPRWLSVWGLLGVPLMLVAGVLELFGTATSALSFSIWVAPLALQEMVFAVWLIVKGFNLPRSEPESSKRFRAARA